MEPPQYNDAPPPPSGGYDAPVEQWRPLAEKFLGPRDADKLLHVIKYESGGDPKATNSESGAQGLLQMLPSHGYNGYDPETAFKWAAEQIKNHGWTDWGENNSYQGKPFGALGLHPYGGDTGDVPVAAGQESNKGVLNRAVQTITAPDDPEVTLARRKRIQDIIDGKYRSAADQNTGEYPVASGQGEPGTMSIAEVMKRAGLAGTDYGSVIRGGLQSVDESTKPLLEPVKRVAGDLAEKGVIGLPGAGALASVNSAVSDVTGLPNVAGMINRAGVESSTPTTLAGITATVGPGNLLKGAGILSGISKEASAAEAGLGIIGDAASVAKRARQAKAQYQALKAAGQSEDDIVRLLGQDAVNIAKGGSAGVRAVEATTEMTGQAQSQAAKAAYERVLAATGDTAQATEAARNAAGAEAGATKGLRNTAGQLSERVGPGAVEPKKTTWTITNAAGEAKTVELDLPHGFQDTGSPEAALAKLAQNHADQQALNDAIRADEAGARVEQAKAGIQSIRDKAGNTLITGEQAPRTADEIASALSAEADRLATSNTPGEKSLAGDVAAWAKRFGDPASEIRRQLQQGSGEPDTVSAATNRRGDTFTDAASAERQAAQQAERQALEAGQSAVVAHQASVEAADLARRRETWLADQAKAAAEKAASEPKPSLLRGAANEIGATIAAPVSLKSNISPPLMRQGLARIVTSPVQAIKEFGTSLKALKAAPAETIHAFYADDPWIRKSWPGAEFGKGEKAIGNAGYTFEDVGGTVLDWRSKNVNIKPEDMAGFMPDTKVGRFTEKITQMFNRQAAVEINLHRTGWYKEVAGEMWKSGDRDVSHYEQLRKTVEQFTHRGDWAQPHLSAFGIDLPTFFSTRALSGRLEAAWRGMAATVQHPGGLLPGAAPSAEREAARAFVGLIGVNMAMLGGAYAAADAVGLKPAIEMDGKLPMLRVGPNRWDPWAGFNSPAKFAIGVISDTIDAAKKNGIENAPQGALASLNKRGQKFLRGGFAPVLGKAADTATGHDFTGQKYNLWKDVVSGGFAKDMTMPFVAENIIDAATQDSPLAAAAVAGPAFLSTGINTYRTADDYKRETAQKLTGQDYGSLDAVQRLKVLAALPEDAGKNAATPERQAYQDRAKQAGYLDAPKDGETDSERRKRLAANADVIKHNPEVDVQRWYFGNQHGGTLNSLAAIDYALGLDLPDREVRVPGMDRAINASPESKAAWKEYGSTVYKYVDGTAYAEKYGDQEAQKVYNKKYAQLDADQQRNVVSRIKSDVAKNDPKLDAVLAYFGHGGNSTDHVYILNSQAAVAEYQKITAKYGKSPAKEGWRVVIEKGSN